MKIGGNEYKLIFLDTNAIREIVRNTKLSGKGFFERYFGGEILYAPCFSIYNVIELMPYKDIYECFLEFFSTVPCLMMYPQSSIIKAEYSKYIKGETLEITNEIAYAFTPIIGQERISFRIFIEKIKDDGQLIKDEVDALKVVAQCWKEQRINSIKILKKMNLSLNIIDDKFYKAQEKEMIIKDIRNQGIKPIDNIDITLLPSMRIMAYSQFNRVHMTKKDIVANDVMDVKISCIIPYIDAVITENFQADVYKKARKLIPQLKKLEVFTLKDIRSKC